MRFNLFFPYYSFKGLCFNSLKYSQHTGDNLDSCKMVMNHLPCPSEGILPRKWASEESSKPFPSPHQEDVYLGLYNMLETKWWLSVNSGGSVERCATPMSDTAKPESLPDPLWLCKYHTALLRDLYCFLEENLIFKLRPTKRRLTALKKYLTTSLLVIKWPIHICQMSTVDNNALNKHFCLRYISLLMSSLRHTNIYSLFSSRILCSQNVHSAALPDTVSQYYRLTYS